MAHNLKAVANPLPSWQFLWILADLAQALSNTHSPSHTPRKGSEPEESLRGCLRARSHSLTCMAERQGSAEQHSSEEHRRGGSGGGSGCGSLGGSEAGGGAGRTQR